MESNNIEFDDSLITQFCDITDTNAETAKSYLNVADGNLENAVQLYFNGVEIETSQKKDPIEIPENDFEGSSNDQSSMPSEQEHEAQYIKDDIRAPIAAKKDILVDDYNFGSWRQPMFQQGFQTLDPFRDFSAETAEFEEDDEAWSKSKKLSELFKVPFDIIYNGTLDDARVKARTEEKWIIINIQESSEFVCQILNRDLWSNQDVKDIIRNSFVFLQYSIQSMEGQQYKQFYQFEQYPHIALIDPRTGERVKYWDYAIKPDDFIQELTEFLRKNNFNEILPIKGNDYHNSKKKNTDYVKNYDSMTEDEQIKAAIEMSMKESLSHVNNSNDVIIVDDEDDEDDDEYDYSSENEVENNKANHNKKNKEPINNSKGKEIESTENELLEKDDVCESVHKKIKAIVKPEPTSGNITRIQFRLPDGKRLIRKFLKEDKVQNLFEYVKGAIPEANAKPFELLNFRDSLIDKLSLTIDEAKLSNSSISISYI